MYSLALALSDDFRTAVRAGFERVVQDARARGSAPQAVTYGLIEGITENAKSCYASDAEISTISIVSNIVTKEI